MKKYCLMFLLTFILVGATSCSQNNKIQGIRESDSGNVAVIFRVPTGMTVEDVLNSEIGSEHTFSITSISNGSSEDGGFVYWYLVDKGGIVSRRGDIYCYGPEAKASLLTGVEAPPAWVMLYNTPSDDEIFKPEDKEKLAEEYGIQLNFQ